MPISRRRLLSGAGASAVLALAQPVRAAKPITVTVASLMGDDKPETRIWVKFAELIEARLPGAFRFNIVKNAALGGEKAVAEGIRLGAIQASLSTVSALAGWVPQSQVLDLPFLFRDAAHVQRACAGAPGQQLQALFAQQQFQVLAFINYGARHVLSKTPITHPRQLQGLKMRSIQSPLHTRLWAAYGATPVAIPIPETYNALANGVADAMDLTKSAYAGFRLYEVVPCLTETAHIWASGVVYFSRAFWQRLSAEQQALFTQAAQEAAAYFNALIVEDETASMQQAAAAGGQRLQPQDRPAWESGARSVWAGVTEATGSQELLKAIRALA